MKDLTNDQIFRQLAPYLAADRVELSVLDAAFFDRIRSYIQLLLRWNRSISLTAVTDPREVVRFHFGESIFAASLLQFQNGRLADFGSGAGFPGLPIRIAVQSIKLSLVESNLRKCAFLSEVVRELDLSNVDVKRCRAEDLERRHESFDFVIARAFGHFELLLAAARRTLSQSGRIVLWLGEKDSRVLAQKADWRWLGPVQIPNSERRFILVGSPQE